ncbi:putative F-box/FBD/LRR-repeat protein [Raphanus sativus]|uniref:F-box/FBD/LRR-repeat protein At5g44950 n=1 Tax=Raphanus sativus TaxID=3726 RepID=A0A6J0N1H4_RAPSA|nr:putative F-box/FBD/LRR-repeat protein At5g44950 [Raphanus sativus]XP_018478260.2 putative F-box/FBD/LRR-repeat protein At5g44950 [Raphanus sativus]KAJ4901561.1 putative F-box/FBD/LRR-repeat protein [Raphanus sativus]
MGYDRISLLPDSLLTQILLHLPTKDSVKTSLLSTRWRNLWLDVPGLDLHSNDFRYSSSAIKTFTDKFLESNRESRLLKFKIKYDECNVYLFGISEWFVTAVNRGARVLDVDTLRCPFYKDLMPLDVYKSRSLVSLKLVNVGLLNPGFVVSLPCLKIMHLEDIQYCSDDGALIVEKLVSGCPVLEDLTLCRSFDDKLPVVLRVSSQTLKRFCVKSGSGMENDAPGLKCIEFRDDVGKKNLSFLHMVDIDFKFNVEIGSNLEMKYPNEVLNGVSSVRHLIISQRTLKELYRCLNMEPISKFHNLSRLEVSFSSLLLQVLPNFLEIGPNLKYLTLYLVFSTEIEGENLELTNVPRCLLSTLECVEIKEVITGEETGMMRTNKIRALRVAKKKKKIWMEVVRYFLEDSLVLKNLILCLTDSDITKKLLTFTKRFRRCQTMFR